MSRPSSSSSPPPPSPNPEQLYSAGTVTREQGQGWRDVSSVGTGSTAANAPRLRRVGSAASGTAAADEVAGMAGTAGKRERPDGKADQIVQHFFAKTAALVSQSRMTHLTIPGTEDGAEIGDGLGAPSPPIASRRLSTGPGVGGIQRRASTTQDKRRVNKWFNIELPETELFRPELRTWRAVSSLLGSPSSSSSPNPSSPPLPTPQVPPMILTTYLDTSEIASNQVLVLTDSRGRRIRVGGQQSSASTSTSPHRPSSSTRAPPPRARPSSVVLERWTLHLVPHTPGTNPAPNSDPSMTELPPVYKHAIVIFRSLFTLLRLLPAWALYRRLARVAHSAAGAGRNAAAGVGGGLKVGVRISVGEEEAMEGEVGVEERISEGGGGAGEEGEEVFESVRLPSVATPVGTLQLEVAYRLNADFSLEDIETLLSSRFIDEDFFKPTVARFQHQKGESALSAGRPGSLPLQSAIPRALSSQQQPPITAEHSPPLTGLAPLPSYGSLSSRHHLTSVPIHPSHLNPHAVERVGGTPLSISPRRDSLDDGRDRLGQASVSSGRFSAYGAGAGTSAGGGGGVVEPAFVSLSRARGASYNLSSSPNTSAAGAARRPSFTSGSSSPIFRANAVGSYTSTSTSAQPALSSSPQRASPSSLGLGFARQQQSHQPSTGPSGLSAGRSPLAGGGSGGGLGAALAAQGSGMTPASASSPASGIAMGSTAPRPIPSPSQQPGSSAGSRPYSYSGGSYSRSYGKGGSSGGSMEGTSGSGVWGGPESFGRGRGAGRFGSAGGGGSFSYGYGGRIVSGIQRTPTAQEEEKDTKRFLENREDDSSDINDFLSLIDSRPELTRSALGGSALGSMSMSKAVVDEQLKALRGSVYSEGGRGLPGPSPPAPTSGLGIMGRGTALRRQTSRLSIEEEREPSSAAGQSYSPGSGSSGRRMASGEYGGFGAAPKIVRKVDPTSPPTIFSSSASTPTSAPPLVEHPIPHHHASRFYLPPSTVSSASSSPARHATTGVPTFTQYISSRSRAAAAPTTTTGFDLSAPASPAPPQHQQLTANSSVTSFSTAADVDGGGGGGEGGASLSASSIEQVPSRGSGYEEEAVGRLELSEEDEQEHADILEETRGRGGRWRVEETEEADEERPPASALGARSRDRTPGAGAGFNFRRGGLPYSPSAVPRPGDYFASRERRHGAGTGAEEDVTWQG